MDNWNFDTFGLNRASKGTPLRYVGYELLTRHGCLHKYKVSIGHPHLDGYWSTVQFWTNPYKIKCIKYFRKLFNYERSICREDSKNPEIYIVRIRIPDPEFRKFETIFFLNALLRTFFLKQSFP